VSSRPSSWKADLALAGITLIWGATFVVVKNALSGVSTMLFLTLRFSAAALVLAALYRGRLNSNARGHKSALRGGMLAGLVLIAAYFFQTQGLRFTTPSKSAFITGLSVALVPILGAAWRRRMPRLQEIGGVTAAVLGLALMTVRWQELRIGPGDLLTMACAVGFAVHILVVERYTRSGGFEILSLVQIATAAVVGAATCWWVETPHLEWSAQLAGALAITSLLATALAFTVMAWAQQHTTATHTALIFSLEPVFAWLTSWMVEGETLSTTASLGAALILGGILIVELKPSHGARP